MQQKELPNCYFPMLVLDESGKHDSEDSLAKRWMEYKKLPQHIQDALISPATPKKILTLQNKYGLNESGAAELSRTLRSIILGYLPQVELSSALATTFSSLDGSLLGQLKTDLLTFFSEAFQQQVFDDARTDTTDQIESAPNINSAEMKFSDALQKFPKILDQKITPGSITIKGSPGSSVPSYKNWITVYHQEMGAGHHEPFERSQFLFHNKNAALLAQIDRDRLSEALKAIDDNGRIMMDTQEGKILFSTNASILAKTKSAPKRPIERPRTPEPPIPASFGNETQTSIPTPTKEPTRSPVRKERLSVPQQSSVLPREERETVLPSHTKPALQEITPRPPRSQPLPKQGSSVSQPTAQPNAPLSPTLHDQIMQAPLPQKRPATQSSANANPTAPRETITPPKEPIQNTSPQQNGNKEKKPLLKRVFNDTGNTVRKMPGDSFSDKLLKARNKKLGKTSVAPEDYTDYYPITGQKGSQDPPQKRQQQNVRFTSSHTLPHETKKEEDKPTPTLIIKSPNIN